MIINYVIEFNCVKLSHIISPIICVKFTQSYVTNAKHNEVQSLLSTILKQLNFVDISNCVNLIDSP